MPMGSEIGSTSLRRGTGTPTWPIQLGTSELTIAWAASEVKRLPVTSALPA